MDGVMLPGNATNTEPPMRYWSPPPILRIHQLPAAYTDTAAARCKSGMLQAMLTIGNAVAVGSRRPSGRLNLPVDFFQARPSRPPVAIWMPPCTDGPAAKRM